jgi:hypothetical protein
VSEEVTGDLEVRDRWHGDDGRIDRVDDVAVLIERSPGCSRYRRPGTILDEVDGAHELHAWHGAKEARVVLAEMTNANDGDA